MAGHGGNLKVLFVASEVAPFAKTGGLADVAGSLPLALEKLGVEVRIMMPRYRGIKERRKKISTRVSVDFVEHEPFFNRQSLYGNERGDYPDNLRRFSFFCHEALALSKETGFRPDIIHAHDWQAALVPVILKTKLSADPFFKKARTLLTIHNLAYQGRFPHRNYPDLRLDKSLFSVDAFEFYGKINLLKAGIIYADAVSTVSPGYAREIRTREYGCGLEGVIGHKARRLRGILNGIDVVEWNPAKDSSIQRRYSASRPEGKAACKEDLQKRCRFRPDPRVPLFGMVTRLAQQKGLDIFSEISDPFLTRDVQFVLLGEGDRVYHTAFSRVGKRHPRTTAIFLGFNAADAHKIYAGCDFFLMPSHYEPCGLGQMIGLRYGTLPIVRKTGGLADTVVDADRDPGRGNGFVFETHAPGRFLEAIGRALAAFRDGKRLAALKRHAMRADFSWEKSAKEYKEYYGKILSS